MTTRHSGRPLEVPIFDGERRGLVSWDRRRCTYRAEIDVMTPSPDSDPQPAGSIEAVWDWLTDPEPGVLPGRLVVGDRPVELLTVDAVINRLRTFGFRPDRDSLLALLDLRAAVGDHCGSVVFLGRHRGGAPGSVSPDPAVELLLGLPHGEKVPLRPLIEHSAHGFGWGSPGTAVVRTAGVLVDLAWSTRRDAATEAAVADLAFTVLAELRGGFVWRVESVAEWIATETGELLDESPPTGTGIGSDPPIGFRQLRLDFREPSRRSGH